MVERVAERERRRLERVKAREEILKETEKAEKKKKVDEDKQRVEKRKVHPYILLSSVNEKGGIGSLSRSLFPFQTL